MALLDGKALNTKIRQKLKEKNKMSKENGVETYLAVVLVGNDPASQIYVNSKAKTCEECSMKSLVYRLDGNTTQNEFSALINTLNRDDSIREILVRLPSSKHISRDLILRSIVSNKDADGSRPINAGYLNLDLESGSLPCIPFGVIGLLKAYDVNLEELDSVVIGVSNTVGRLMTIMLLSAGCTVSICHIKTKDLSAYTQKADLIIVVAGCINLFRADMVKEGAIIINIGTNRLGDDRIVGDMDFGEVSKEASSIIPVPGGVSPMTIAMLLENTAKSVKNSLKSGV